MMRTADGLLDDDTAAPQHIWRLGRFFVLKPIGSGASGAVHVAFDPTLERKVALKVLHATRRSPASRQRFLREARIMAQLSHPNIVAVHEVHENGDSAFLCMELVDGAPLHKWLAQAARSAPQILGVFLQAARGLMAAHDAGVVHRDFKPANVLVSAAGRAIVIDFGLAHALSDDASLAADAARPEPRARERRLTRLTHTGAMIGTPAYMAPEQFTGQRVDSRSDQFGFCAALWEALYGELPFAGVTLEELRGSVCLGRLRPPVRSRRVPPRIESMLRRGLSVAPKDRWPTMAPIIATLAQDAQRARRRLLSVGLVAAMFGSLGAYAYSRGGPQMCRRPDAQLAGIWDEDTRSEAENAFRVVGGQETWNHVEDRLDDFTATWLDQNVQACVIHEEGRSSDLVFDRRMQCLDDRREHFNQLMRIFIDADAEVVRNAVRAVADLGDLRECIDPAPAAGTVVPLENRAAAAGIRAQIAEAQALQDTGRYAPAVAAADSALAAAVKLGHEALVAEAELRSGLAAEKAGQYPRSHHYLLAAYTRAGRVKNDDVAAEAAASVMFVLSERLGKDDEALSWRVHTEVALARASRIDRPRLQFLSALGGILESQGRLDEAEQKYRGALALLRAGFPADDPDVARMLSNLGQIAKERQDFATAIDLTEQARAHVVANLGTTHPDHSTILNNLGAIYSEQGEPQKALDVLEQSLAIKQQALDPWHPDLVKTLMNMVNQYQDLQMLDKAEETGRRALEIWHRSHPDELHADLAKLYIVHGNTFQYRQEYAASIEMYRKAVTIQRAVLPGSHPAIAFSLGNMGAAFESLGRHPEAAAFSLESLKIRERTYGPRDPRLTIPLQQLCKVEMNLKHYDLAEVYCLRAREIAVAAQGEQHPALPFILTTIGDLESRRNRLPQAAVYYDAALRLRATGVKDREYAASAFGLADTLWILGRNHTRALELAQSAREIFARFGPPEFHDEVDTWIRARQMKPPARRIKDRP